MASLGALSGRAFLDTNGNGVMDADEKPIPGAGFLVNGSNAPDVTDASGVLFVPNLVAHQRIDVSLAAATLEDPYWKPGIEGIGLVPRPGKTALLDFPVVVFGDITGTVYGRRDGQRGAAANVELELVDPKGTVVKKTRSAYDGFYELPELRPGSFTLRVSTGSLARLGAETAPASRSVELAPAGTVLEGVDFVLELPPSGAPPPASVASGLGAPTAPAPAAVPPALPAPTAPAPAPVRAALPVLSPPAPVAIVPKVAPAPAAPAPGREAAFTSPEWTGAEPLHAVHISSYRERGKAEADARKLGAELGLPAHVFKVDLGPKGTWYRVVLGAFQSAAEARTFQAEIASKVPEGVGGVYRIDGLPEQARAATKPAEAAPLRTRDWSGKVPVFVVHISSFRAREKARAEAIRLAARFETVGRAVVVDLGEKGIWYRVVLGEFATSAQARHFADEIAPKVPGGVGGVYRVEGPPDEAP